MTARIWRLAHGRSLALGSQSVLMGIVNATPDSFSGDGMHTNRDAAVAQALQMEADGATVIDIGGESTRPNAQPISAKEEQGRVLPVIEALRQRSNVLISVDTYRSETARLAVAAGANIVNDVWGLARDPAIASLAAETGAGLVLMHTGREREKLEDVIADQLHFLAPAIARARQAGVQADQIVLDPGFGFAKETVDENIELMVRFSELAGLDLPWLVGTSRKRFVGALTGREPADRDVATAATSMALRLAGADIFRVHNVAINKDALAIADAMLRVNAGRQRA